MAPPGFEPETCGTERQPLGHSGPTHYRWFLQKKGFLKEEKTSLKESISGRRSNLFPIPPRRVKYAYFWARARSLINPSEKAVTIRRALIQDLHSARGRSRFRRAIPEREEEKKPGVHYGDGLPPRAWRMTGGTDRFFRLAIPTGVSCYSGWIPTARGRGGGGKAARAPESQE
ncbi:hypothetical protein CDAR_562381 [Caerostris darwini]|uniref:Uncharacterized protein n=1 Tax=Caerostris darwini TaxID=1538125 RepID=A0AAV4X6N1_9ARAC|nr:hypothetical protein CDAR_562381 [Caerostris darwini]